MENITQTSNPVASESKFIYLGYALLSVSAGTFALFEWLDFLKGREDFAIFIFHYLLAITYTILLISRRAYGIRNSWSRQNIGPTIILINLYLLSAYALNRTLPVFEDSTDWLCVYIILIAFNLLSFQYFKKLPGWLNCLQLVLLGSAFLLFLYMTFYVADIYVVGAAGIIALGIGAHIFVPVVMLTACIFLAIYTVPAKAYSWVWISAGFTITLIIVIAFSIAWNKRINVIDRITNQSVLGNNSLPTWVSVSENLPMDALSEKILKSDLVYTVASTKFQAWAFIPDMPSWNEPRKHDPLVFIASVFTDAKFSREDKIKVLQTRNDRHRAEERLWSGENLVTSYVVSDIDLYPDLRLAYTERYLTIHNRSGDRGRWRNTEEAIYTFQLPEGSVVTSLSLWINGKEAKGILTTKQKAKRAYNSIVGVEMRDPSVIHWQEGNTLSVRVFPCTVQEDRKFKIGITSPLIEEQGRVRYTSPMFKGPDATTAMETIRVSVIGSAELDISGDWQKDKKGNYLREQKLDQDLNIFFPSVAMKENNRFVFDGYTYRLLPYNPELQPMSKCTVYLDVNASWNASELSVIKELASQADVFVYVEGEFLKATKENWDDIVSTLTDRSFSLFPFHLLSNPEESLVVTKGKKLSIQLSDFRESDFAKSLEIFFASGRKPYVYNLGTEVSTYIASMRELRGFNFAEGNAETLIKLLKEGKFPKSVEHDGLVTLYDSKLLISKTKNIDASEVSNAPDHLARLFAYNDIMRKVGSSYFEDNYINTELTDEAASAYVVSPVSSLIVLESAEDYKRFDINDKENSLHNAAKNSSGAVPEPHEWVLIILFLILIAFLRYRAPKLKAV